MQLLVDKLRQKMYIFEAGSDYRRIGCIHGTEQRQAAVQRIPGRRVYYGEQGRRFDAGGRTIGRFAIRINGGTLLHEVLHDKAADGTRSIRSMRRSWA